MPRIYDQTERDAERYEQYRVFEEKTDIGERLSLPIENRIVLPVVNDAVYGHTVTGELRRMTEWSHDSYLAALKDSAFDGANAVERVRRRHEYEEACQVEALRSGEALIVFSPIPDAARAGTLSIQGYRTDLARTFCRLYYRQDNEIEAVTLSLEQSNKVALSAAMQSIGGSLDPTMGSEEILARRQITSLQPDEFKTLPDQLRYHYDISLFEQTGRIYFAGNFLAGRQDSMRFMNENHDIIDEHMALLRSIEARYAGKMRDEQLEHLRQRTAAALDERLHGGVVGSLSDQGVSDRLEGGTYGGECAIGASGTQEAMGLAQGKHTTNCPLCGTRGVTATVEGETITCSDCRGSVDICTGKVTRGHRTQLRRRGPSGQVAYPKARAPRKPSKETMARQRYGKHVSTVRRIKTIGGEDVVAYDRTGELLGKV